MSYIFQFTLCIINHLIHIVNRLIMMIIRPESPIVIPRMGQVEQATFASINTISETEPTYKYDIRNRANGNAARHLPTPNHRTPRSHHRPQDLM